MNGGDPTRSTAIPRPRLGPCLVPAVLAVMAATGLLGLPAWAIVKTSVPLATVAAPWWYTAVLVWAVVGLPVGLLCTTELWRRADNGPSSGHGGEVPDTRWLKWVATIGTAGAPSSLLPLAAALAVGIWPHAHWLRWYGPLLAVTASLICIGAVALGLLAGRYGAKATGGLGISSSGQAGLWGVFAIAILGLPLYAVGSNLATAGLAPSMIGDVCVVAGSASPIFASLWLLHLEGAWKRCGLKFDTDIRARGAICALITTWVALAWLLLFGN